MEQVHSVICEIGQLHINLHVLEHIPIYKLFIDLKVLSF